MKLRRTARGFTFMEIIIVMVILAVLAAIALPRMGGTFQSSQLRAASREVMTTLRYARHAAILREQPTEVLINPEVGFYQILPVKLHADGSLEEQDPEEAREEDADRNRSSKADDEAPIFQLTADVTRKRMLPSTVFFTTIASSAEVSETDSLPRIIFFPDGSASAGTIALQNLRKQAFSIEVFRTTGLAQIKKGEPILPENTVPLYVGPEQLSYEGYR